MTSSSNYAQHTTDEHAWQFLTGREPLRASTPNPHEVIPREVEYVLLQVGGKLDAVLVDEGVCYASVLVGCEFRSLDLLV